jgi:hypothetical protein
MPNFVSRLPIWARWFSLGVILALVGGIILMVSFLSAPSANPGSQQQTASEFYTAAALTLSAGQALNTPTLPVPPTSMMSPTPSSTNFPAFGFTQPATQNQPTAQNGSGCNNSIYIRDVTIPDGTILAPGTNFVKTWMFQNTGTCTWDTNYQLIFITGQQMGGKATKLTNSVAPYQQAQVSVSLTAPSVVGNYTGYWRLADGQGNSFGGSVTVVIVVSNSAPTITPTVTSTAPTRTPTATSSGQATATPSLTATPTIAPSATNTEAATNTPTPTPIPSPTETPS